MKIGYFWKISLYCLILNVIHFCLKDNHIYHHSDARFVPKSPLYAALSETVMGRKWEFACQGGLLRWCTLVACSRQVQLPCVGCALHARSACRLPEPWAHQRDRQHRLMTTNTDWLHALHARVHVVFPAVTATVCSGAHLLSSNVISSFHVCLL